MSCPCNGGSISPYQNYRQAFQAQQIEQSENCEFTRSIIKAWLDSLKCVKENNKLTEVGLDLYSTNRFLGILQSSLNYPDNYCYYQADLITYQTEVLPKIILNVPNCI